MTDDRYEREQQSPDDEPVEQPWSLEHPLGDPDAWRGAAVDDDDEDAWRSPHQPSEWPEWDAGPEYLMWKRIAEEER